MATQSSDQAILGAGFSPLRGEPTMGSVPVPDLTITTCTTAAGITLTAAQLLGGLILHDPGGAVNDTTDTAANIVKALPGVQSTAAVNNSTTLTTTGPLSSFQFDIINTADGAETITLVGGTGVTIAGTATIAQSNGKRFICYVTTATKGSEAVTIRSLGTYTS